MNGETKLWKFLQPRLKKYGHFERIESHETAVGTPDVHYCIEGYCNSLELKYTESERKGFKLRPAQAGWFKRRVKAKGQPWLLAQSEIRGLRGYVLIPGSNVPALARTTRVTDWLESGVGIWEQEIVIPELIQFLSTYLMVDPQTSDGSNGQESSSLILPSKNLIRG